MIIAGATRRKMSAQNRMENFDVNRYLGRWHEIARLDHRFERGLERITATYTLRPDGKVGVVNRGYDLAKKRWSDAKAYAVQTRVKNYLKVYFFPLVPGRYRIAYLDDDYSLAVVSGGSLRYLWLLSRTPEVTPQQRARMLGRSPRAGVRHLEADLAGTGRAVRRLSLLRRRLGIPENMRFG